MRGQVNSRKIGCLQRCRDRTRGENVWFKCSIVQETVDESRCTAVLPRVTPKPGLVLLQPTEQFLPDRTARVSGHQSLTIIRMVIFLPCDHGLDFLHQLM